MAGGSLNIVLRHLRRLAATPGTEELTDRRLLQRFAAQKDEAAFAELVRRHGPLVLGVCRRVLRHEQDAEDVFQATFLVLARKAATTRWDDWVGHYLYEVAYRLAIEARGKAARRREHERRAAEMPRAESVPEGAMRELCAVLDEELRCLPDRYRKPMLLCYLEGQTRDRAARQLGWALRTLERRLERGRELLRVRLTRRGLTLSGALLAAGLAEATAAEGAPPLLLASAVRAAASFAAGGSAVAGVSARAALLAEGALAGMAMTRLKLVLAWVLALGLAATGTSLLGHQARSGRPPEARAEGGPTPVPQGADRPKQNQGVPARTDRYGDPLPPWALARMGTIRFRHGGAVSGLAFSPDGRTIGSGSFDRTVRLWEAATGKELRRFQMFQGFAEEVAFAPDGKKLFARPPGRKAYIWELGSGKLTGLLGRQNEEMTCFAPAPDGKTVATGHRDFNRRNHVIRFWDVASGKELRQIDGHEKAIMNMAFSPDGKLLASVSLDQTLRLWRPDTGKEVRKIGLTDALPKYGPLALAFSPDGTILALGTPKAIRLWDPATAKEQGKLPGHESAVWSLVFAAGGKTLYSSGQDGRIRRWDVAAGKELPGFKDDASGLIALSADGKFLASGRGPGVIRLWDPATGEEIRPSGGHRSRIWSVALAPDGKTLATAGADGTLRLWESATGKEVAQVTGHQGQLYSVTWSADGKALLAGGDDQIIHLWDPSTGKELRRFRGHEGRIFMVTITSDGKTLASGSGDWTTRLWDVATGRELRTLETDAVHDLALSPDGKVLASASFGADRVITLWDAATGKEVRRLEGHENQVSSFVFSADGRTLVSGSIAGAIHLWDVDTGKLLRKLAKEPAPSGETRQVTRVALSPDGKTLLSGEEDGRVLLWEMATGQQRGELAGDQGSIVGLAVSADGRLLASSGADTTAVVWDLTGRTRPGHRPGPLSSREREALWVELGGHDARKTFVAVCRLAENGQQTAAFLRERLRPAPWPDARLLADLEASGSRCGRRRRRSWKSWGTRPSRSCARRWPAGHRWRYAVRSSNSWRSWSRRGRRKDCGGCVPSRCWSTRAAQKQRAS
jgi:RNA polymerase sigma factor (sigma-70 family)